MLYAQIKDGEIKNIIVLDDRVYKPLLLEGFDYLKRIDNRDPIPMIGDLYDEESNTFSSPQIEPDASDDT